MAELKNVNNILSVGKTVDCDDNGQKREYQNHSLETNVHDVEIAIKWSFSLFDLIGR